MQQGGRGMPLGGRAARGEAPVIDAREVRKRLKLSQRAFAARFGFNVATLRHWERGNRKPSGTALVLLFLVRDQPGVVMRCVRKARFQFPGALPEPPRPITNRAPPGSFYRRVPFCSYE